MVEHFATPAVSVILKKHVNKKDFILIQERQKADGGKENGMLEIPGGKIREYENIFSALRREVKEETGMDVTSIHGEDEVIETIVNGNKTISFTPFCTTQNLSGAYSLIVNVFICEANGDLLVETNETQNLRWVNIKELENMVNNNADQFFLMDVTALKKYFSIYTNSNL
ncbi:NUDIX hydrolase [Clostridium estertheticum]|uniref:8-oxo-dGTP diphosphatase n=1 Tax=Clostridium estertheticum TaxID=238834 RepID=A0A7Y3SST2_9CLOT|nr:NUDIX domain-containing protein [Clostridium estertheticum]MBU3184060.1 NUDIX domain-containing protein [Clostridium estertheticum]MCB2341123.1 NUDIX domain-containing protein [Clostridium estertheticum]NNU74706.1 NUDIX domain-containing protein [Clostridium estertheticum]WBL47173.1 NUDIX domain-containing protein [Clostridium estertheticum]